MALTATITPAFVSLVIPGCTANQDNSPISISNSQSRLVLSVACNTDGSVAYVTDGRNVYCYASPSPSEPQSWQCILSQAERLEVAMQHDSREQQTPGR